MKYQININYQFQAESEAEARGLAEQYISENLKLKQLNDFLISPGQVAEQCRSFRNKKQEHFCIFLLDTQNNIIGKQVVSVGTLNASLVHPREVFRKAIIKCAASVIVAHNHPSGSLEPSMEDINVTKRLNEVGKLVGIQLLDHVIVTADSFTSIKEKGLL